MSEPIAKTPEVFKFDAAKLEARLTELAKYQEQFAGKPNHNPFLWIKQHLTPLYERLKGAKEVPPETSKELHDSIMAVKMEPCVINPHAVAQEQEKPKVTLSPSGVSTVVPPVKK